MLDENSDPNRSLVMTKSKTEWTCSTMYIECRRQEDYTLRLSQKPLSVSWAPVRGLVGEAWWKESILHAKSNSSGIWAIDFAEYALSKLPSL